MIPNAADVIAAYEHALVEIEAKISAALAEGDEDDAVYNAAEDAQDTAARVLAQYRAK